MKGKAWCIVYLVACIRSHWSFWDKLMSEPRLGSQVLWQGTGKDLTWPEWTGFRWSKVSIRYSGCYFWWGVWRGGLSCSYKNHRAQDVLKGCLPGKRRKRDDSVKKEDSAPKGLWNGLCICGCFHTFISSARSGNWLFQSQHWCKHRGQLLINFVFEVSRVLPGYSALSWPMHTMYC